MYYLFYFILINRADVQMLAILTSSCIVCNTQATVKVLRPVVLNFATLICFHCDFIRV